MFWETSLKQTFVYKTNYNCYPIFPILATWLRLPTCHFQPTGSGIKLFIKKFSVELRRALVEPRKHELGNK